MCIDLHADARGPTPIPPFEEAESQLRNFLRTEGHARSVTEIGVAVGTPVARRRPHRSVRELQLIRLLPRIITVGLPLRDIPSARPPVSVTRQTRRCVRTVRGSSSFSLAPALPSKTSADGSPPLFGSFVGTMTRSDSSTTFARVVRPWPSPAGLPPSDSALPRSPGSRAGSFPACTGSTDRAGLACHLR